MFSFIHSFTCCFFGPVISTVWSKNYQGKICLWLDVLQVLSYILDRNVCLLPSYFAVNEITKLFSDDRPAPHWVHLLPPLPLLWFLLTYLFRVISSLCQLKCRITHANWCIVCEFAV